MRVKLRYCIGIVGIIVIYSIYSERESLHWEGSPFTMVFDELKQDEMLLYMEMYA